MTAVVHIAGVPIQFGSVVRQRCSWCGAVLIDTDLEQVQVLTGDADRPFPTWEVGGLVRCDGAVTATTEPVESLTDPGDVTLPADACARDPWSALPEAVARVRRRLVNTRMSRGQRAWEDATTHAIDLLDEEFPP